MTKPKKKTRTGGNGGGDDDGDGGGGGGDDDWNPDDQEIDDGWWTDDCEGGDDDDYYDEEGGEEEEPVTESDIEEAGRFSGPLARALCDSIALSKPMDWRILLRFSRSEWCRETSSSVTSWVCICLAIHFRFEACSSSCAELSASFRLWPQATEFTVCCSRTA